jgi:hypothetical protein
MTKPLTIVLASAALLGAAGCAGGYGNRMQNEGQKSFTAGDYDACVYKYGESLKYWFETAGVKPGEDASFFAGSIAQGYHGRAWCRYKKADLTGAVEDITQSAEYFNQICHSTQRFDPGYKKTSCKQGADDLETLARWSKESNAPQTVKP